MIVVGLDFEQTKRVSHPVPPVAQKARSGGARVEVWRTQQALKQGFVDGVMVLIHPKRFHQVVFVFGILWIQVGSPLIERVDDFPSVVAAKFDFSTGANSI